MSRKRFRRYWTTLTLRLDWSGIWLGRVMRVDEKLRLFEVGESKLLGILERGGVRVNWFAEYSIRRDGAGWHPPTL